MTDLPDEQVTVRMSSCKVCHGWVRTSVVHAMTRGQVMSFAIEAHRHNLTVTDMPLLEWRQRPNQERCNCKP